MVVGFFFKILERIKVMFDKFYQFDKSGFKKLYEYLSLYSSLIVLKEREVCYEMNVILRVQSIFFRKLEEIYKVSYLSVLLNVLIVWIDK